MVLSAKEYLMNQVRRKIIHLRRPLSFYLSKSVLIVDNETFRKSLIGCYPGGSTANVFSHWTDGDVVLRYTHVAQT